MIQASQIREHMKVVGSDGGRLGWVDHVVGEEIELAKFSFWPGLKHHMIPLSWVESVDKDVHLNRTKATAKSQWREKL